MIEDVQTSQGLSGWILPDGRWYPTAQWWHLSGLYDLRDEGYAPLQTPEAKRIFKEGDEAAIRDFVSKAGFIKISALQIDGEFMTDAQLNALKDLLLFADPDDEIEVLSAPTGFVKKISVKKVFTLKKPTFLFDVTS